MQRLTTLNWVGSSPKHTAQRVSASKSFKQTGMVLEDALYSQDAKHAIEDSNSEPARHPFTVIGQIAWEQPC